VGPYLIPDPQLGSIKIYIGMFLKFSSYVTFKYNVLNFVF